MVCVAMFILFSKLLRVDAFDPEQKQSAQADERVRTYGKISRRRTDWRGRVKAAPQGNGAGRPESPPSKRVIAWRCVLRTRMCCVNSCTPLLYLESNRKMARA